MKRSIVKSARSRHRNRTGGTFGKPDNFHSIITKAMSAFKRALKKKNVLLQESLLSDIEHIVLVVSGDLLHLVKSNGVLNESFGKDYARVIRILKTAQLRTLNEKPQKIFL